MEALNSTRDQLGELATMAHQTQAAERQILERATARLEQVQADLKAVKPDAMTGDGCSYMDLIDERGRLQQVIAKARDALSA